MSSPSENKTTDKSKEDDKELDELLNSALEDFETPDAAKQGSAPGQDAVGAQGKDHISDAFTEEFSDELAKEFEDAMKSFLSEDPAMLQQIEKLAEAAGTAGDTPEGNQSFNDSLKQTLESLAQNTEGLQDHGAAGMPGGFPGMPGMPGGMGGAEDVMKMFGGMGLEGGQDDGGFMPMMQTMMKTLLSKDVLYPSLKEISDKYPSWLSENKEKITDKEYTNYDNQNKIIVQILAEFDKEQPTDSDTTKTQRFELIMDKMQKMQELGQPPKEIVGDMAPGLEFDANGMPKFPEPSEACVVM